MSGLWKWAKLRPNSEPIRAAGCLHRHNHAARASERERIDSLSARRHAIFYISPI
jgi:hypothetical protein